MIFDIIRVIQGKIFFVLVDDETGKSYFIDKCKCGDNNEISFKDAISDIEYTFNVDNLTITTYADNTIPIKSEIEEFDKDGYTADFFKNDLDHKENNKLFTKLVDQCKELMTYFNMDDSMGIKGSVMNGRVRDLEYLRTIGYKVGVSFRNVTFKQSNAIMELYWKFLENRLEDALNEIDETISDNDEEFKKEAEIIKKDLIENVDSFRIEMRGVSFDKLFKHWPTLLNPSPFNHAG